VCAHYAHIEGWSSNGTPTAVWSELGYEGVNLFGVLADLLALLEIGPGLDAKAVRG